MDEEKLSVPERVCGGVFSGEKIAPLFRGAEGEIESEVIRNFPGSLNRSNTPVCELSADGGSAGFRVVYTGYPDDPGELKRKYRFIVEFGPSYGAYSYLSGTITLDIPCPTSSDPKATLFLNMGASAAREGDAEGMTRLEEVGGYAARTLAQKVYKCKGAEKLPEGPVHIKKGAGTR
ncbi:hypothetical protein [Streptomyces sp. NPDC007083]|uniref:hypothetical protein n=1 Tax=Streptomyces sp. NPDC007083 TaxID=3156913 RepID=UPI0033F3D67D